MKKLILSGLVLIGLTAVGQDFLKINDPYLRNIGSNSGIAVMDFDNDGDEDLLVSVVLNSGNKLFRNNGDLTFTDVTSELGLDYSENPKTLTSIWVDLDNDDFPELFLVNDLEPNRLFKNNNGTFEDITVASGVGDLPKARSINAADIDSDGFLDIYVSNQGADNIMYRNNGDMTFENITDWSGTNDILAAMASVFFDYDNDGDQDLYLTHDRLDANILYENNGNGQFTDVSEISGLNFQGFGMGTDVGDFNRDGHLDVYVTNLFENFLFINNGDKTFTEIGNLAGVDDYGMGWGTVWFDCDNDGWEDLYLANDTEFSPYENILYENNENNTFSNISTGQSIGSVGGAFGCATGDFNNDGKLDVFVANKGRVGNELFINETVNEENWIKLKLRGTVSNRMAVGARVSLLDNQGILHIREINAGSGYASQNSPVVHIGLGSNEISEISIRWPNGLEESFADLEVNQYYLVEEGVSIELFHTKPSVVLNSPLESNTQYSVVYSNSSLKIIGESIEEVSVLDLNGRILKTIRDQNEINLNLSPGIYVTSIVFNDGTVGNYKFIAQ